MTSVVDGRQLLSESKFYESYSRYSEDLGRYESWDESIDRVMNMHRVRYASKMTPELETVFEEITAAYKDKLILGAQRSLQFGGDQILKHNMRLYNCTSTYGDRPSYFGEFFYILLCGAGAGVSVQKHHVARLPKIMARTKSPKIHTVEDSIEGWATALDVLMSSFFEDGGKFPEFKGRKVAFDLTKIRQKNSPISGGFLAPGPEPLRRALDRIEYLLTGLVVQEKGSVSLRPIHVYDISMHASDAVLSGGVRRAATIFMFSPDDTEMAMSKTGNWFVDNPQRGRSNNSAVLVRGETTREQFADLMKMTKEFGEPGFVWVDDREITYNPCVSGDALITVRDHDVYSNDELIAEGQVYQLPMHMLVDIFTPGSETNPLVLSYDTETNEKKFVEVSNAALTRKGAEVIRIETDDGKSLILTPDHKVYTTNRGWVEAKDLTEEDDLVTD